MDFILSAEGVAYNAPAIMLLVWVLLRRPVMGLLLAALVWLRVVEGVLDFSMHACISSAALIRLPGWERVGGVALGGYTAWWYLASWGAPLPFWQGILLGAGIGSIALLLQLLVN